MSVYFLLMACLVGSALATVIPSLPSYMKICNQKDPKVDACIASSMNMFRPHLVRGIPELKVPGMEPLVIDYLPLANSPELMAVANLVSVFGLSEFIIRTLHFNAKELLVTCEMFFENIGFRADYNITAKIGPTFIAANGPLTLNADGVVSNTELKFERTEHNGQEYMTIKTVTTKLDVKGYNASLAHTKHTDPIVIDSFNHLLENNKDLFKIQMLPSIETTISGVIAKFGNKICGSFPADILFPDKE